MSIYSLREGDITSGAISTRAMADGAITADKLSPDALSEQLAESPIASLETVFITVESVEISRNLSVAGELVVGSVANISEKSHDTAPLSIVGSNGQVHLSANLLGEDRDVQFPDASGMFYFVLCFYFNLFLGVLIVAEGGDVTSAIVNGMMFSIYVSCTIFFRLNNAREIESKHVWLWNCCYGRWFCCGSERVWYC